VNHEESERACVASTLRRARRVIRVADREGLRGTRPSKRNRKLLPNRSFLTVGAQLPQNQFPQRSMHAYAVLDVEKFFRHAVH
jgi:hypothetical protein